MWETTEITLQWRYVWTRSYIIYVLILPDGDDFRHALCKTCRVSALKGPGLCFPKFMDVNILCCLIDMVFLDLGRF